MAKKKKYLEVNCSSSMPEVVIVSTPGVQFEKKPLLTGKSYYRGNGDPKQRVRQIVDNLKLDPHTLSIALELEELLPEYLGLATNLGADYKALKIDFDALKLRSEEYQRQIKIKDDLIISLKSRLGEF